MQSDEAPHRHIRRLQIIDLVQQFLVAEEVPTGACGRDSESSYRSSTRDRLLHSNIGIVILAASFPALLLRVAACLSSASCAVVVQQFSLLEKLLPLMCVGQLLHRHPHQHRLSYRLQLGLFHPSQHRHHHYHHHQRYYQGSPAQPYSGRRRYSEDADKLDEDNNPAKRNKSDETAAKRSKKYYGGADEETVDLVERRRQHWQPEFQTLSSNPHILQVELNPNAGYESRTDIPFTRILTDDSPQTAYRRRKHETKTVIHWGQRKLLLSEIEFLLRYGQRSDLVVYAGAAPGTHIAQLSVMFPQHRFVCVDPAPFSPQLSACKQLLLRQEKFTDQVAEEYAGRNVLFVSDIRSVDPDLTTEKETDHAVRNDQDCQMRWHDIMKPAASMLKFRLPWDKGTTEYLDGEIYLPVWGPITTTEARLMVTGHSRRRYDNQKYEAQLFHFNTRVRVGRYAHGVKGEGIDYCYDCKAEIEILRRYFIKEQKMDPNDPTIDDQIAELSRRISRSLGQRTLQDANADPGERKQGITKTQWIGGRPAYMEKVELKPVYSSISMKMMERMGHAEGAGLGARANGITAPIEPQAQAGTRGLGFAPSTYDFDRASGFVQGKPLLPSPGTPLTATSAEHSYEADQQSEEAKGDKLSDQVLEAGSTNSNASGKHATDPSPVGTPEAHALEADMQTSIKAEGLPTSKEPASGHTD
eukprot:m.159576 g.159576  ORF g.159576 m.159576 type:complete len:698 (+) comp16349_c1_seq3:1168-3261(+)